MKNVLFLSCLIISTISTQSFGKTCQYDVTDQTAQVQWTAFKTPKKVGVKGLLPNSKFLASNASSLDKLLESVSFSVVGDQVDSKDQTRDKKLLHFFFKKFMNDAMMRGFFRSAKATDENSGKLDALLYMNDSQGSIALDYEYKDSLLTLKGKLDVLEFGLNDALESINKACFKLHEGKTWSDVEVQIQIKVNKTCK